MCVSCMCVLYCLLCVCLNDHTCVGNSAETSLALPAVSDQCH